MRIGLRSPIFLRKEPNTFTTGWLNSTEDGFFIPFLDFDGAGYEAVLEDVRFLQRRFDVGTMAVLVCDEQETPSGAVQGHYHAVAFTKFTLPELKELLSFSRCDEKYKTMWERTPERAHVLRLTAKRNADGKEFRPSMKLKEIVFANLPKRIASGAHVKCFSKLFGVPLAPRFGIDGSESIAMVNYPSLARRP